MFRSANLLLASLIITACVPFKSEMQIFKKMPPLSDSSVVYLHNADREPPKDAVFIADMLVKANYYYYDHTFLNEFELFIENEARLNGANIIYFQDPKDDPDFISKNKRSVNIKTKLYFEKPPETVIINNDSLLDAWSYHKSDAFEGTYTKDVSYFASEYSNFPINFNCIKRDSSYIIYYLNGFENLEPPKYGYYDAKRKWKTGDILAIAKRSINKSLFESVVFDDQKMIHDGKFLLFEDRFIRFIDDKFLKIMPKIFPDSCKFSNTTGSRSGFSFGQNRILTFHHSFDSTNYFFYIRGINGDFLTTHEASIEYSDTANDLIILKLTDSTINLENSTLYLNQDDKNEGDEIYILGFPILNILEDEIKSTSGLIKSKTGFDNNNSQYLLSIILPDGSNGSPLFDKNGYFTGIVNNYRFKSKIYNSGCAIKSKAVYDFIFSKGFSNPLVNDNSLKSLTRHEQIKVLKKGIYLVEVYSKKL
ncbi:MAG: serine protease [Candidatus Kapabacteria bacterium]|nr:serine protease [Candidatus Kapabacteria bacterium]